jgi:hypothetical protein
VARKKETGLNDLFKKTEAEPWPADNSDLDEGNIRPSGVGLREGEIRALDEIAAVYDIARNAVLHYAARRLILDYRAGKVDLSNLVEIPVKPKKRLRLPNE